MRGSAGSTEAPPDLVSRLVHWFLHSNLSIILILFSVLVGLAALWMTPREEDPQIVVPLADVYVQYPGHNAAEVEQLVAAPLERLLYQIDGVEYVYSLSQDDRAMITVRFYVGQDRERSLVKLFKKLAESEDQIPAGVAGWVMKPVEIDDVPIVTLALSGAGGDSHALRRIGEEWVERLATVPQVSRAYLIGGEPRVFAVEFDRERLQAHQLGLIEVAAAVGLANQVQAAGEFARDDRVVRVESGWVIDNPETLRRLVVGVHEGRPVSLSDVANVVDGPAEPTSYVRHGWGPARHFAHHSGAAGTCVGETNESLANDHATHAPSTAVGSSEPAVTVAIAKQKGANAVAVADAVLQQAAALRSILLPDDVELIVTRNSGQTADEKVNELIEALGIAIVIVILLLTIGLGWREALIVAVAIPVVFGLTLAVNWLCGYTINRVTLFALILALGLLVDDPIVDVENIARHFAEQGRATKDIVLAAVSEIRPPLISATLAVIVSFLPMFFITGMMGPYMAPMALNVPVAMLMSMLVAFTITPWMAYQVLGRRYQGTGERLDRPVPAPDGHAAYDPEQLKTTFLYRFFRPLMQPLLKTRSRAVGFLLLIAVATVAAMGLAAMRQVPLKMLPFDNKNELLLVLDLPEGTSLERTNAVVESLEHVVASIPEVVDYTSHTGVAGPIDFNGLVRHYYWRNEPFQAEIRLNLAPKKQRNRQSHALGLAWRDRLGEIVAPAGGLVRVVELPPGPPVLASIVAEVTGRPDHAYSQLLQGADLVAERLRREPGVVEVDTIGEAARTKWTFDVDQEKAALTGVSVQEVAETLRLALGAPAEHTVRVAHERTPLQIEFRLPRADRSQAVDLSRLAVRGMDGDMVPLAELGRWRETQVSQSIYRKNMQRVAYVMAETAGRPPAECIVDVQADRRSDGQAMVESKSARPVAGRSYFENGSEIAWSLPPGFLVRFAGEGEWKITLDVFRDLGLAFGAAMLMIYIILVAQTGSFALPLIVMMAIPLTALGVMPGFWLLGLFSGGPVAGYPDPVYFTATAMIGMIALAGIVTRDAIILVDFMQQAVDRGRPLFDAILESRVVRLRPILLTAGAAALSAIPITLDPIFSGLGWALIFGLAASTIFTLFVIPVSFWLLRFAPRP